MPQTETSVCNGCEPAIASAERRLPQPSLLGESALDITRGRIYQQNSPLHAGNEDGMAVRSEKRLSRPTLNMHLFQRNLQQPSHGFAGFQIPQPHRALSSVSHR